MVDLSGITILARITTLVQRSIFGFKQVMIISIFSRDIFLLKRVAGNPTPDEHIGLISSWEDFHHYPWPTIEDVDFSSLEQAPDILPQGMGIIARTSGIFQEQRG